MERDSSGAAVFRCAPAMSCSSTIDPLAIGDPMLRVTYSKKDIQHSSMSVASTPQDRRSSLWATQLPVRSYLPDKAWAAGPLQSPAPCRNRLYADCDRESMPGLACTCRSPLPRLFRETSAPGSTDADPRN